MHFENMSSQNQFEQKNMNIESFASEAGYEIKEGEKIRACCVDGRVSNGREAANSKPGADAGDLLVSLGALRVLAEKYGIDTDSIRPKILEAVVASKGGALHFSFHTDSHAAHDLSDAPEETSIARGCGHLKNAEKDPSSYGVTADDMKAIFMKLLELKSQGAKEDVLEGEHGEGAVLVVEDETLGAEHSAREGQSFVYHSGLDAKDHKKISKLLAEIPELQEKGISEAEIESYLESVASLQRWETLSRLASGLPIYKLEKKEGGFTATSAGIVAPKEEAA